MYGNQGDTGAVGPRRGHGLQFSVELCNQTLKRRTLRIIPSLQFSVELCVYNLSGGERGPHRSLQFSVELCPLGHARPHPHGPGSLQFSVELCCGTECEAIKATLLQFSVELCFFYLATWAIWGGILTILC